MLAVSYGAHYKVECHFKPSQIESRAKGKPTSGSCSNGAQRLSGAYLVLPRLSLYQVGGVGLSWAVYDGTCLCGVWQNERT